MKSALDFKFFWYFFVPLKLSIVFRNLAMAVAIFPWAYDLLCLDLLVFKQS